MPSPEAEIRNVMLPYASGGVYFDSADIGTAPPFIVINEIGGQNINFLDGTAPSKRHIQFEVNVFAKSRLEANTIARQVEAQLRSQLKAYVESEATTGYDEPTNFSGTRQEFSAWFNT